jgi:hypothetical protein
MAKSIEGSAYVRDGQLVIGEPPAVPTELTPAPASGPVTAEAPVARRS